jgi:hypothetical protein
MLSGSGIICLILKLVSVLTTYGVEPVGLFVNSTMHMSLAVPLMFSRRSSLMDIKSTDGKPGLPE